MKATVMEVWGSLLFKLFIWSGTKLFGVVAIYDPSKDKDGIKAVHFAVNEYHLIQSAAKLSEDNEQ